MPWTDDQRAAIESRGENLLLSAAAGSGKTTVLVERVLRLIGEGADSLIFFPLAVYGVIPTSELPILMFWQVVLKTSYEVVVLPITIRVVNMVKAYEGEDVYDEGISYDVLKVMNV